MHTTQQFILTPISHTLILGIFNIPSACVLEAVEQRDILSLHHVFVTYALIFSLTRQIAAVMSNSQ